MYTPIIHNLKTGDLGYNEAQAFNTLIANKPKGNAYNNVKQSVGA